jgi:hypothetical protein
MMKNLIQSSLAIAISTFTWCSIASRAEAFNVILSDNNVTKVEELEILGNLYNVDFFYGTADELFKPDSPYSQIVFFNNGPGPDSDAVIALRRLVSVFNSIEPKPLLAGGSSSFLIPLSRGYDDLVGVLGSGRGRDEWVIGERSDAGQSLPAFSYQTLNYAVFTPAQPKSVPEPISTIGLLVAAGLSATVTKKVNRTI